MFFGNVEVTDVSGRAANIGVTRIGARQEGRQNARAGNGGRTSQRELWSQWRENMGHARAQMHTDGKNPVER